MKEILLSKSFVGSFGDSEENIPHEIINRFRADNGEIYIYVPPYGGYDSKKHNDVEHLIITGARHNTNNKIEVLYLAKDLKRTHLLHNGGRDARNYPEEWAKLKNRLDSDKVSYGGALLTEIPMISEGDGIEGAAYFATFKVETLLKPRKKMFLSLNAGGEEHTPECDVYALNHSYKFRQYGFIAEDNEDYATVSAIIKNGELWCDAGLERIDISKLNPQNTTVKGTPGRVNFLKLIHKESDETVFTNLFYEAFNRVPGLFADFAKEVLDVHGAGDDSYKFVRKEVATTADGGKESARNTGGGAKGRIDLLAEGEKSVIVIENKIDSALNGIDREKGISQLTTYIEYVEKLLNGRKGYYFLLHPDYNDVDIEDSDRQRGKDFKKIAYSEIYGFMTKRKHDLEAAFGKENAEDFLEGLSALTLKPEEKRKEEEKELKEEIERRFIGAIGRAKKTGAEV